MAYSCSNISLTDNGKNYYGTYINDDWKVTHKLTVNLGLRWDFFGLVFDHRGNRPISFRAGHRPGSDVLDADRARAATQALAEFPCFAAQDGIAVHKLTSTVRDWEGRRRLILRLVLVSHIKSLPNWWLEPGSACITTDLRTAVIAPNIGENYPFQFQFNFECFRAPTQSTPSYTPTRTVHRAQPRRPGRNREPWRQGLPALRLIPSWSTQADWTCAEFSLITSLPTPWVATLPSNMS